MKIFIVVNAYVKNKSQLSKAERLGEELKKLGAEAEVVKNFRLADLIGDKAVGKFCGKCIFLDKDRAAAYLLEGAGCKLYNSARAMELCDDKMLTHATLSGHGIPMPDSIYAPLCYYEDAPLPEEFLKNVAADLRLPLVAKLCYGSLGSGVFIINSFKELCDFEEKYKLQAHFYQKFIRPRAGMCVV